MTTKATLRNQSRATSEHKPMIKRFCKEAGFKNISDAMTQVKKQMVKTACGYDNDRIKVSIPGGTLTLVYQSNPDCWCGVCFLFKWYYAGIEREVILNN
ncbi:MAG: hypothetical protein LBQ74_12980 [Prevotella sp.]|jgi:hypothetical protein|nr:hypothetical protein [Prevotella sp.]